MITALLKVSRLNLMPIQWGKATGTWLTHPSMLHRVQRIAKENEVPDERLHELLDRHTAEVNAARTQGQGKDAPGDESGNHYDVPSVRDPERVRSATSRIWSLRRRLLMLIALHVVPPALVAWVVGIEHFQGTLRLGAYLAGLFLTLFATNFGAFWVILKSRTAEKQRAMTSFRSQGLSVSDEDIYVGLALGPQPRFYGTTQFNWDLGFLALTSDRLVFTGEHSKFSLSRDQITRLTVGQGPPIGGRLNDCTSAGKTPPQPPKACSVWVDSSPVPSRMFRSHSPL